MAAGHIVRAIVAELIDSANKTLNDANGGHYVTRVVHVSIHFVARFKLHDLPSGLAPASVSLIDVFANGVGGRGEYCRVESAHFRQGHNLTVQLSGRARIATYRQGIESL